MKLKHHRGQRRHERARLNKKTRFIMANSWYDDPESEFFDYRVSLFRDNLKACSCPMCCNPRRSGWNDPLTIQELKALEDYEDQMKNLDIDDLV